MTLLAPTLVLSVAAGPAAARPHGRQPRHAPAAMPPPALVQDTARQLRQTEQARAAQLAAQEKAAALQAAASAHAAVLAQQRTAAATRLRDIESQVDTLAGRLRGLSVAQRAAEADIAGRSRDLHALLPLVLRLSLYPTETVLAVPAPPDKAVEGLLITQGLAAEVARQVAALRQARAAATASQLAVTLQRAALDAARASQAAAAASLDRQEGEAERAAQAAQDDAALAAQAAARLAARADSLRGAIKAMATAQLQAQARAVQEAAAAAHQFKDTDAARKRLSALSAPPGPGLAAAPKILLVAGHVAQGWGAPAEDGPATGVTFSAAPAAFVSSPCAGRVGFAAPFRSYGRLMIVECGGGYDFVLAGMDRLDAAVGTHVDAGEPVGRMPDYDPATRKDTPGLYVELRHAGTPIDPTPFLGGRK